MKKIINYLGILLTFVLVMTGCVDASVQKNENPVQSTGYVENVTKTEEETTQEETTEEESIQETITEESLQETLAQDGFYTSKEDVALYLYTYGTLPDNFITKKEARNLGWEGGGLDDFAKGHCIGGDKFGSYEGLLPQEDGRQYYECDIDTMNQQSRGAKRIVFSNDGLIYYTDDHYKSFELLYDDAKELAP